MADRFIYFDHAATTYVKPEVLDTMLPYFTEKYGNPSSIYSIGRESKRAIEESREKVAQKLQNREDVNIEKEEYEQETFWNRIMAEHSKFIRGLLDPTEDDLINKANDFAKEFDQLTEEAKAAMDNAAALAKVTEDSISATKDIRDFKAQGTSGILECKVKSIIIPLLADHTLREANHFLRLLNMFESTKK